jgi:ribosome-associated protein
MSTENDLDEIRRLAISHLYARKAQDVSWLDLRERSTLCDCYVLATCHSAVQLQSILAGVRRDLSKVGKSALRSEAAPGSSWGVLDFGNLIVHVFLRDAREHYALERLWKDAPEEKARPEDYVLPDAPVDEPQEEPAVSGEDWE